ncbi:octaprenyl-diphosphate synthase [Helicobacter monodelphidis]|nr:octaprenyl-diphosphate synthase [Helicobacter sp. 15-1451]
MGGKMLRSRLVLAIAQESAESKKLCAIIELIQSASLLHDDVIDDSLMRRGNPSLNASVGSKNAIMVGDILYSKGFYELSFLDPRIAQVISSSVVRLSNGEILDVCLSQSFNSDQEQYMRMIENKTASLIEASSEAAALLVGLDAEAFRVYGKNLGIAFQIIDDLLDITQDSSTLGKESLSDFKEGKTTLPYIYLYESFGQNQDFHSQERLKSYFKKTLTQEEQQWIIQSMQHYDCIKKSFHLAKALGEKALQAISAYNNTQLEEIMTKMIERDF